MASEATLLEYTCVDPSERDGGGAAAAKTAPAGMSAMIRLTATPAASEQERHADEREDPAFERGRR
jgi:hypothetical protein